MSTFNGIISEFPEIRIDYFHKDPERDPPLACFLSHIHTDHLKGLNGFYCGPFIHCSAATKDLLIKLERRQHRINFAKGIVESIDCRYKELKKKLKPIPLETPTEVEIGIGKSIRVTLFDANHCVGSVIFLIEGNGKAVLYTGDVRSEPWWVECIARHPVMIPYTSGMKRLDNIYLDTSNVVADKKLRMFPSKREGLSELVKTLSKYPNSTIFHFNAWTFGYEDVWVALAATMNSKIHLCDYRFKLFKSISSVEKWADGPYLGGFKFGNDSVSGCLTRNPDVRIHSCEFGTDCEALRSKNVVYIRPIITRVENRDVEEEYMEQCTGDLETHGDLWLHDDVLEVILQSLDEHVSPEVKELLRCASKSRKQALGLVFNDDNGRKELDVPSFLQMLAQMAENRSHSAESKGTIEIDGILSDDGELLPRRVGFPYSRHASHAELRDLVGAFRPKQVYANTVNDDEWDESNLMGNIFGDLCEGTVFYQDDERREEHRTRMLIAEQQLKAVENMAEESQFNLLRSDRGEHPTSDDKCSSPTRAPTLSSLRQTRWPVISIGSSNRHIISATSPHLPAQNHSNEERKRANIIKAKPNVTVSGSSTAGSSSPFTSPVRIEKYEQTAGTNRVLKRKITADDTPSPISLQTGRNPVEEKVLPQTKSSSRPSSKHGSSSNSSAFSSSKALECPCSRPPLIPLAKRLAKDRSPPSSPPFLSSDPTDSGS